MKRTWWKESVIYQIYPRSFKDSNGDGIGDLRGIIEKLDYLQELGVDLLWLNPIYKSPNDDNGYDISDYYSIMEEFGTIADFDELLAGTHARGMRLLMDLVVNHTSDEHQWFQESRKSKENPYRDYYIWKPQVMNNWRSFFSGSVWEYDEPTEAYYLHLFSKKQPDLNWEHPKVREEVYKFMRFWLDKGIDGFRMDAVCMISKRLDFADHDLTDFGQVIEKIYANGPRVHEFLQEMHQKVLADYDVITVGEATGVTPEMANLYVGEDRQEMSMMFQFGHMSIDHGSGGRYDPKSWDFITFKRIFKEWHDAVGTQGWINVFLDNHDFPRMVSRFANDREYRVQASKLLATLILTLRGTPCIYYGSEIGMTNMQLKSWDAVQDVEALTAYRNVLTNGEDTEQLLNAVNLNGRDNGRTPMQWDDTLNAGFSKGKPWLEVNPNYLEINVQKDQASTTSIFRYYQQFLRLRKAHKTFVYGDFEDLAPAHPHLYAYCRWDAEGMFFVYLNFSDRAIDLLMLPKDKKLELIISNYPDNDAILMKPWEARVYRAKAKDE